MNDQPSNYKRVLKGLLRELHSLDAKLGVLEALRTRHTENYMQAAPVLFGPLADSLMTDILLTVAKLYERKSERSIHKLLRIAESQRSNIESGLALGIDALQSHRATINSHGSTLEAIVTRRNKYIAHYDKEYFDRPRLVDEEFPVSAMQVEELILATQTILAEHCRALGEPMLVSMADMFSISTKQMLTALVQADQIRERAGRTG